MRAFDGYSSWQGWLMGKALPLTFFTFFLAIGSLSLSREAVLLAREGATFYPALDLIRHGLTLGFILLIVAAYLTRTQAVRGACGFWERIFPLLVLLMTLAGMSFLGRTTSPQRLDLTAVGLLLSVPGYYISLWALWYLRGSFAIMAEARSPVTSGPYCYVRHPLYLGETITLLGLCLVSGTATALFFWAAVTGMQLTRALVEERKLAQQFEDYQAYQKRTRFILPGLY